jgi:maltose-binding protein MalE
MRNKLIGIAGGLALALASGTSAYAQELTIFWAEWDPANYLQELVNDYEAETGVSVTVETTPWSDFQTKAFTEFNARGSAYDMIVGDSQWLGAASEGGHYVDLTDFFNKHNLGEVMAPATVKYYAEYPGNSGKFWAVPAEGDAVGWSYRKDWFEDPAGRLETAHRYRRILPSSRREPLRDRHLHGQFLRCDGNGCGKRNLLLWGGARQLRDLRGRWLRQQRKGGCSARKLQEAL